MDFIASAITDPSKLIQLPFIIFDIATKFAFSMFEQSMNFANGIMKIVV